MKKFFFFLIGLHTSIIGFSKTLDFPVPPADTISYSGSAAFCPGGNKLLKADPAPIGASYQWKLNGTNINGAISSSYPATQAGSYIVVVDTVVYRALQINMSTNPVADLTFNNNACSGTGVQLNSIVSGGTSPFTYSWAFGDGGASVAQNPIHPFISIGCGTETFSNSLTVKDVNGCTNSVTKPIVILQAPDVQIQDTDPFSPFSNCDKSPTSADPDFTLTVKNISSDASCISTYSIDWGDGNIQNSLTAASFPLTHVYTRVGAFNLVVTGLGTNGCTASKKYIVANQSNPAGSLGTLGSTTNLCVPATVPFTIGNWKINSPGTIYSLSFGDGTSVTLNHPLNTTLSDETVNHTYLTTSCPQSSYTAVLQVINACDNTPYTAGNIQIRIRPVANFTKPQPACAGQNVCFDNTSKLGSYGPNCSSATSYSWDFGDESPLDTRDNPCHTYTNPGDYSVSVIVSNPCGTSTITLPVCVTIPPVPAFTLSNALGCAPLTVATTNATTSLNNNCAPVRYLWSVSYQQAFCETTPLWNFINNTTDSSVNPSLVFKNPGVYTITLSVTNTCGTFTTSKTVTVKQPPVVTLSPVSNSCGPVTITPAANISACGTTLLTYAWTFSGGVPASSSNENPGPVSFTAVGSHTISLAVTNECGTTTVRKDFSIDSVTQANAGPDQNKCGTTTTMAASAPVIGTGAWTMLSGPNTPVIIAPSSPTTSITGLAPGTYIFQWTITNGSCFSSSNVTIVIANGASPALAGPDQNMCLATSATLVANTPSIGTGTWSYVSGSLGYVITDPSSPTTTVTGLASGEYVFRWTINFNTCTPNTDDVKIIIYDNPTIAIGGPDQTICVPNTTLAGNTPANGTGSWSLVSGPNIPFITTPSSPATTITGMVTGIYLFKWTISNLPCSSNEDTVQIAVTAITNNSLSGNQQICFNTSAANIAGSIPTGGNGSYSYQWQQSIDGGNIWAIINGASGPDYNPGVLIRTTCYKREVTTTYCADSSGSNSSPICITVNPDAKALFIASDTVLCPGVNLDTLLTVTPFPEGNLQYNWYADNIFIAGNTTGKPPSYLLNNPGQRINIKLVTISSFGCKPDSKSINFRTLPAVTAKFKKDTSAGCGPITITFTNTSSILNSTIQFYWNFGDGSPVQNILQPAPVTYSSSTLIRDTVYYITLKAFSGCDTTVWLDSIKVFADPHARFTSRATGCSPFRDTIINNSVGNNFAYYWDFGDGKNDTTYTTGKFVHNYNTGIVDTFTIRLIALNGCGRDTQSMNLVVSPNIIQSQISINGNELYGCAPHTVNFLNSSTGASLLYFNYGDRSPEETIPNSQSRITHTYLNAGIHTIRIRLVNDCTDTMIVKYVTVYSPPVSSFKIDNAIICTGNTITTNNTSLNANSYEWIWGDNTGISSFNATHTYSTAGIYNVRLVAKELNNFGTVCTDTSATIAVNVVDRIPAVINIDPGSQCAPYNIKVSAADAANAALVDWYFYDSNIAPGIFHITGPTASYTYNSTGVDSVKLVVQNLAGCKDSAMEQFTVHKTPAINLTPFNIKTCNTDTTITFNVSLNYDGTDPVTYKWYINDQLAGLSNPFTYNFQVPPGSTSVNNFAIKVLAQNSFGCGDTAAFGNFIIQTLALQRILVSPSLVQEQPDYTFTFSDTSIALPNTIYLWNPGGRNLQQLSGREVTYTYGDTGMYKVLLLVTDYETGCIQTDSTKVTILAVPGYLYVPNAFCPGCQKAELRNFLPLGKGLKDYHLTIFNIYGQKIFETTHLNANGVPDIPWDGKWLKDQLNAQQDAYSWHIEAHYINGTEWKGMNNKKSGFITIIR